MGDGFYRSKDPTNSIKVLKEHTVAYANNAKIYKQGSGGEKQAIF